MFLTRHSRGQTLPIWAMGLAAALALAFGGVQYGEVLRWQVRAQNAADAAAVAALSVQTQTWNQQLALVYAASVEEWRIKNLLNALQAAAYADPGCTNGGSNCQATYDALKQQYYRAVQRYTTDVQLVSRTSQYTFAQAQSDARAIVAGLQAHCGETGGGDCAFSYNVVTVAPRPTVNDVEQSAGHWVVNNGTQAGVKQDYLPAEIEIVTCAKVAPVVPAFLNFQPPTFTAIGRAAATSAMVTQEWIQPGTIVNPVTGNPFQSPETLGLTNVAATGPSTGSANWNWFTIAYGGNSAKAYPSADAYSMHVTAPEFSVATGWWNAIPVKPFSGALNMGSVSCASS
jgi:Putative Flp pilus-assembly TadE/G-like